MSSLRLPRPTRLSQPPVSPTASIRRPIYYSSAKKKNLRGALNRRPRAVSFCDQLLALLVELNGLALNELYVAAHAVLLAAHVGEALPHLCDVACKQVSLRLLGAPFVEEPFELCLELHARAAVGAGGVGVVERLAEVLVLGV